MSHSPGRNPSHRAAACGAHSAESWREYDDHLGRSLLAGDERVLEELLASYGPGIRARLSLKYRGVLAADEIDDTLLEALHRLWRKRRCYDRQRGSVRGWLWCIAKNAAQSLANAHWRKVRGTENELPPEILSQFPDRHFSSADEWPDETPDSSLTEPAELQALHEILEELPQRQREVVLAATEDGLSSRQISQELGISAATVRVHKKRGVETIRSALRGRGFNVSEDPRRDLNR